MIREIKIKMNNNDNNKSLVVEGKIKKTGKLFSNAFQSF